ncbi:Eco57I restriction-modification methylase domain-containing protein, partial [Arthrobacter sp. ZGTC212]|uniref:Eco57I restriction-modification methylase domain-containing protein n=1 Tax=Arthrobacter sp. ZGTC212 TaxID=2058899 RepID=UPI000CE2D32C
MIVTTPVTVLNTDQRRFLDAQTQRARAAAERAGADALRALAVGEPNRPPYLSDEQNKLRLALRDKARQLGDDTSQAGASLTNLIHDVAYEQWHRLLFARFLEVNGLLRHPEYRDIPLSLEDCGDLASDLAEPDAWAVAARFASEILPGVFRLTDPSVMVRFAAEHRNTLERLLLEIPAEVFTTEDALGWVYQFWQTAEKKRVNDAGIKVGGADLSPVTQLFTENYMVRFLLENSLGAWWTSRHPESLLAGAWEYLRRNKDGTPAAGAFNEWPDRAADVTVMDPCCGSGHFLVAMFGMLWRMRAEEEGLTPAEAQDAVLRDNLHGLELDPRCTQIATFNVALEAWKQGGFRELPSPQIACSGVPVRAARSDWEKLAGDDGELRKVMGRLHSLFRNADTLGSLLDPRPADQNDAFFGHDLAVNVSWTQIREVLTAALRSECQESTVLGHTALDVVRSADLLARRYHLLATNPPFLGLEKQSSVLESYVKSNFDIAKRELALVMLMRLLNMLDFSGSFAVVLPSDWMHYRAGRRFRKYLLEKHSLRFLALLGNNSFYTPLRVSPVLAIGDGHQPGKQAVASLVVSTSSLKEKPAALKTTTVGGFQQSSWLESLDSRITLSSAESERKQGIASLIGDIADARNGLQAGDAQRFDRYFWEIPHLEKRWELLQHSPDGDGLYSGRKKIVLWESEAGEIARLAESVKHLNHAAQNWRRGKPLWGRPGIAVSKIGAKTAIYLGDRFDSGSFAIVPHDPQDHLALVAFALSGNLRTELAKISPGFALSSPQTLLQLPFDIEHWRNEGARIFPQGLPAPASVDPSQWLFSGEITTTAYPLQVAVARLLGYRWPKSVVNSAYRLADSDGIAALVALPGEPDLVTRLRKLLEDTYGNDWSSALERKLVTDAGGKNGRLDDWLRDSFFAQHVRVFDNRPFLWHIWDGRKDGFSAIVNYHKLDRRTLEKLTFTSLGAWIDRQKHEARAERAGADARLAAAEDLQRRLQLILDGAPPYDIYVRWKGMAEQPIGWEPDIDDGVRLNIRPFVNAGVLRAKVNVHWRKDRGTNPDGS